MNENFDFLNQGVDFKILHIVSNPFFVDRGGLVRVYEEIKATLYYNKKIYICCYPGGRNIDNIKVFRIPLIFWYKNKSGGAHDLHRLYLDFFLLIYSFYVCLKIKPNIIHSHGITGIISGKLYKLINRNCVVIQDAEGTYAGEIITSDKLLLIRKFIAYFEMLLYKLSDAIICSNFALTEVLKVKYHIKKPIITIPDGIGALPQIDLIHEQKIRNNSKEKIVGFLGLLIKEQGIDYLFEAIQEVIKVDSNIKFYILGHPNEQKYQLIFNEKGLKNKVRFLGAINYDEVYNYLSLFDIAISPKLFETTAANGKLLSFIAVGLPTVVFEHPVNRFYLGEFGIYAEYKNSKDLANKILQLLDDDILRAAIKDNLKKQAQLFLWSEIIKEVIKLYYSTYNNLKY